jgi:hypothetical protein
MTDTAAAQAFIKKWDAVTLNEKATAALCDRFPLSPCGRGVRGVRKCRKTSFGSNILTSFNIRAILDLTSGGTNDRCNCDTAARARLTLLR